MQFQCNCQRKAVNMKIEEKINYKIDSNVLKSYV